ncbi:MAG TPA: hypothetical protein VD997_14220 [Phycisphaerales bacterium]|nr:hypothetical protein [Phycisphaerales bacterium]
MTDLPNHTHHHQLVGADADAVDALIDAGFDLSRVPQAMHVRAGQAAALMGLIGGAESGDGKTLIDVTMARLARIANPIADVDAVLSADDAEALDAYVSEGFRAGKVPSSLRARAERLEGLGQLLTDGPAINNTLLIERTMRAVSAAGRPAQELSPARTGGFRFADLISVAAVLLMGVAVVWPVMSTAKSYSTRSDCMANLAGIASAFGRYTNDFRDQLPMAAASFGGSWLNVGTTPEQSNSANLYTLARTGYTPLETLACEGNPMACRTPAAAGSHDWKSLPEVSYSYYIMFGKDRPSPVSNPGTVILTDKSPVPVRLANGEVFPFPNENSPNHAGQGQFALRADGSALWATTPQVGSDNIWMNRQQEKVWNAIQPQLAEVKRNLPKHVKGTLLIRVEGVPMEWLMDGAQLPADGNDVFVGP